MSDDKTYTKEEFDNALASLKASLTESFDKKLAKAVADAESKGQRKTLEALDVDDPDEAKAKLEKLRESEDETSKLKREVSKLLKRAEEAESKHESLAAAQREAKIETAVLKAASEAVDPEAVLAILHRRGGIEVDDAGQVSAHGKPIDKAVGELLTKSPWLARGDQDRGGAGSQETAPPPEADAKPKTEQERVARVQAAGVPHLYPFEADRPGNRFSGE